MPAAEANLRGIRAPPAPQRLYLGVNAGIPQTRSAVPFRSVPFRSTVFQTPPFRSVPPGSQNTPVPFPFRSSWNGTERNGTAERPKPVPFQSGRNGSIIRGIRAFLSPPGGIFRDIPSGRERSERRDGSAHFTQYEARAQRAPDCRAHFKVCEARPQRAPRR